MEWFTQPIWIGGVAMAASSYGTYPAQAIEPFPVETQLANILGSQSPGEARLMLGTYGIQRDTAERQYADLMQQQRGLAYATLQQQMVDRMMQTLPEIAKTPGLARFAAQSPLYSSLFGGAGPGAITGLVDQSDLQTSLGNLDKFATAYKTGAEGGLSIPPQAGTAYTGVTNLQPMTPISTTNAGIAALNRPEQTDYTVPVVGTRRNPNTGQIEHSTISRKVGEDDAHFNDRMRQQQHYLETFDPKNPGTPGPNVQGAPPPTKTPASATGANATGQIVTPSGDVTNAAPGNPLVGGMDTSGLSAGLDSAGQPIPGQKQAPVPKIATNLVPALTGGGSAQAATPQSVRDKLRNAPDDTSAAAPPKVRPANMPDTNSRDVADWTKPAGVALQGRARQGLNTLSPADHNDMQVQASKLGIYPVRVKDNIPYYIRSDGSVAGPVP